MVGMSPAGVGAVGSGNADQGFRLIDMIALLLVLSSLVGCAGETLTNVKNALPDLPPETFSFSVELEEYARNTVRRSRAMG